MTTQYFTPNQHLILSAIKQHGYKQAEEGQSFTTTSGNKTAFYYDMRKVLTDPIVLRCVVNELDKIVPFKIKSIGGMAYGAIPLVVAFSMMRGIPYYYIRKDAKGHGMKNQIEGDVINPTWLLDDVYNTGSSFQYAREALTNYFADGRISEDVSHEMVFAFMGHMISTKGSCIMDRDHNFYGDNPRPYSIKAVNSIFTHQQFQDFLLGHYSVSVDGRRPQDSDLRSGQ